MVPSSPTLLPSALRLAASLTRATVDIPKSSERESTILPMKISFGKMPPSPLVQNVLPGFQVSGSRKVAHLDNAALEGSGAADYPGITRGIVHASGDLAVGVAQQHHLRASEADRGDSPTKPSGT
jgi:hypothetical protein